MKLEKLGSVELGCLEDLGLANEDVLQGVDPCEKKSNAYISSYVASSLWPVIEWRPTGNATCVALGNPISLTPTRLARRSAPGP